MEDQSEPVIEIWHAPDREPEREPDRRARGTGAGRPLLSFEERAPFGMLWVLSYLDDPCSPEAGVEEELFPGDRTDAERVYREAQAFLRRHVEAVKRPDPSRSWRLPD